MAEILSVGIDIGTSTTQLVFSRITMEDQGGYFSVPRVSIVDKEVIYRSEVYLTPLLSPVLVDGEAVGRIAEEAYRRAGFTPADVDTGAVIITGESARKENAAAVLDRLSVLAGEFVVSTAGPDLESVIAGKGSGAWAASLREHCVTANLDIGGGTTNMVIFSDGEVIAKGCLDIGGRLIRVDGRGVVTYLSPAAEKAARAAGAALARGRRASAGELSAVTDRMARLLDQALGLAPLEPLLRELRTPGSSWLEPVVPRQVFFSGGVANYIGGAAGEDLFPFGDIGVLLGRSIAAGDICRRFPARRGEETIRATVVGAGMFTTTISGSTITCAAGRLPLKNVPVLRLTEAEQARCQAGDRTELARRAAWLLDQSGAECLLLALPGREDPSYEELRALAESLAVGLDGVLPPGAPVLAAVEQDVAKALGGLMDRVLAGRRDVVCIDAVRMEQGDYVDLGRPLCGGLVIPVVVKTLLFG